MQKETFFKNELVHLKDLVNTFYTVEGSNESLMVAVELAFKEGLKQGRFWVGDNISYEITKRLNIKDDEPLICIKRSDIEGITFAGLYDSLHNLDSWLGMALRKLDRHEVSYPKWDFSNAADKVCRQIKKGLKLEGVSLVDMSLPEQKVVIKGYEGESGCEAGSFSTPEKLSPYQVKQSLERGHEFMRWVLGSVYSHGLFCAKVYNRETLIKTLSPIYKAQYNSKVVCDNGNELWGAIKGNELIQLFNELDELTFRSQADLDEAIERSLNRPPVSAEEKSQKNKARIAKMFDESEEAVARRQKEEQEAEKKLSDALLSHRNKYGEFCDLV